MNKQLFIRKLLFNGYSGTPQKYKDDFVYFIYFFNFFRN